MASHLICEKQLIMKDSIGQFDSLFLNCLNGIVKIKIYFYDDGNSCSR